MFTQKHRYEIVLAAMLAVAVGATFLALYNALNHTLIPSI